MYIPFVSGNSAPFPDSENESIVAHITVEKQCIEENYESRINFAKYFLRREDNIEMNVRTN